MFPHERSLVKRMQDKPFALLGVSVDEDKDALKQALAKDQVSWRNWWDPHQKIASKWDVQALPAIYMIDAKGVIRFVPDDYYSDPESVDRTVDALVKEAEGGLSAAP